MGGPPRLALAVLALAAGCASYQGAFRDLEPARLRSEPGWIWAPDVRLVRQRGELDCGAAALAMVLAHAGVPTTVEQVTAARPLTVRGLAAGALRDLARARGARAFLIHGDLADLRRELEAGRPVVVGLVKPYGARRRLSHYEVVVGLHPASGRIATLDPGAGPRQAPLQGFLAEWDPTRRLTLVVMRAG